ncbi:MAG: serine protein kinase [Candidatus Bipolaricaulota bacterium]|nr:serine protein kinase [Candidatus Bipolaricaulota bacterium]MCS7274275.1 serine protein kinase [Candidatus Bipolaricaulota bacterium]MDW8111474.1 serine protein kinase [Candidatus Bipolaricaulota bacterium]MDW8329383.1 serine protein kinase [Candidatus Bipolaricaulota bacterium]
MESIVRELAREIREKQVRDKYRPIPFSEYLEMVFDDPRLVRNAYQRLYDMILSHGTHIAKVHDKEVIRYNFFDDPFSGGEDAIFGIDEALKNLVDTFHAAAKGLGPDRRIILLHGPVATSKSTIGRLLRRGLEEYSNTDDGRLYTFEWDVSDFDDEPHDTVPCPIFEEPLRLIPLEGRQKILAELNRIFKEKYHGEYTLRVEGDLCPKCRFYFNRFMRLYEDDLEKVLKHVTVRRLILSEKDRRGIATFEPKDKKNQDEEELTGGMNWRLVQIYGSDSDPRAFNYDGELCVANRGIFDGEELLKLQEEFLYDFLHATQEHVIKPKKNPRIDIDTVILGRTNNPEYRRVRANEKMEAFNDRTRKIDIPYVLRVSDEEKIYRKFFGKTRVGGKHIAPHTLRMAALWAILTRLDEPTGDITILQKAKLYNGEAIPNRTVDLKKLRDEAKDEGFFGISPRYVIDMISKALVNDTEGCINPYRVLAMLEDNLAHHSAIDENRLDEYKEYIELVKEELSAICQEEVRRVISHNPDELREVGQKYLDHVMAYLNDEKVEDRYTGEEMEPDEEFMRSIEKQIGITEAQKDDFRQEISNWISERARKGEPFNPEQNDRLRKALEKKLWEDKKHNINFTAMVSDKTTDPEHKRRKAEWIERLKQEFGYCDVCAENVIVHAGAEVAREELEERERH